MRGVCLAAGAYLPAGWRLGKSSRLIRAGCLWKTARDALSCTLQRPSILQAAPSSTSSAATASQAAKMREGSANLSGRSRQYVSIIFPSLLFRKASKNILSSAARASHCSALAVCFPTPERLPVVWSSPWRRRRRRCAALAFFRGGRKLDFFYNNESVCNKSMCPPDYHVASLCRSRSRRHCSSAPHACL